MFVILLHSETVFNIVQVNGTVTTNSTTIPYFISFTDLGTKSVNVESGFYSITLPNNRSYEVVIFYHHKVLPIEPNSTNATYLTRTDYGLCLPITFDLHAKSSQLEYDISCPKM